MEDYFETKFKWDKTQRRNVCIHCNVEVKFKYIATGHDHTDYSYTVCSCVGARKVGRPWKDLK